LTFSATPFSIWCSSLSPRPAQHRRKFGNHDGQRQPSFWQQKRQPSSWQHVRQGQKHELMKEQHVMQPPHGLGRAPGL